jgi:FAD synthetase
MKYRNKLFLIFNRNLALSFNGGKDCTVLLHLLYVVFANKFPDSIPCANFLTVYFELPDTFDSVTKFITEMLET